MPHELPPTPVPARDAAGPTRQALVMVMLPDTDGFDLEAALRSLARDWRALRDGDTFGFSETDRNRITYQPSLHIPETTVVGLELTPPGG